MRVPLPQLKPNGVPPPASQVFAITGICQRPKFRLAGTADVCVVDLAGDEPSLLVRRVTDAGAAAAGALVEWEGVFEVLSNDDSLAEQVFADLLAGAEPDDVQRQWTSEAETVETFASWLRMP